MTFKTGILPAVLALLFCAQANAGPMMKPGPSPEAGFAGVWRIIGAEAAPWAKPRTLARSEAPLLEYAVVFKDASVEGPEPLGCKQALFASGVTYPVELFGGRFKNDKDQTREKAIHLSDSETSTYSVTCGKDVRDYYMDDAADMLMAEGDVIYTLQRPTGMEPNKFAAGYSGPSFDCTKAKAAADQIICADAHIAQYDRTMGTAYERLRKTMTPESFATVQASQRAWLADTRKGCGGNGAMPDDLGKKNDLQQCLDDAYQARSELLNGMAVVKSGGLTIEPRARLFVKAKPNTEDSDVYPWMTGGPQAAAFNAWIARAMQLNKRRMDDKNLFAFGDDIPDAMRLYAHRDYSIHRFDARVVSMQIVTFDYTGGAHEVLGESALNWNMAAAKPFGLADVFRAGSGWEKFVIGYCAKDLKSQFGEDNGDPDVSAIPGVVNEAQSWLWGKDKATVHFTVYTVTSFAGGEYDVEIPYKLLKPYMKPDAPVL